MQDEEETNKGYTADQTVLWKISLFDCVLNSTMSTHPLWTHTHPIPMSTSEKLSRFDLKIHEIGHQERLAVNDDVTSQ
jgi:hypothetical protein